jgi:hypothetical protein
MCKFFSAVVTKENIYFDYDLDSHEDIIKKFQLKEGSEYRGFELCRVELLPEDNNVFNHDMDNWHLVIDQDIKPDWIKEEHIEKEMKIKLHEVISNRFILNFKKEISYGRWFVSGNAKIDYVYGDAKIYYVSGDAIINSFADNYKITSNIADNAIVIKRSNDKIFIQTKMGKIENIFDLQKGKL